MPYSPSNTPKRSPAYLEPPLNCKNLIIFSIIEEETDDISNRVSYLHVLPHDWVPNPVDVRNARTSSGSASTEHTSISTRSLAPRAPQRPDNLYGIQPTPSRRRWTLSLMGNCGSSSSSSCCRCMFLCPRCLASLVNMRFQAKAYQFIPHETQTLQRRPRRPYEEIDRPYGCNNCPKAYGTLNHLNTHIKVKKHGDKRLPIGEFYINDSGHR